MCPTCHGSGVITHTTQSIFGMMQTQGVCPTCQGEGQIIKNKCKECGGEIAVSYDEKNATTDFVCTQCGKRIPENKVSQKTKKAMRKVAFKEKSIVDSITKLIGQIKSIN